MSNNAGLKPGSSLEGNVKLFVGALTKRFDKGLSDTAPCVTRLRVFPGIRGRFHSVVGKKGTVQYEEIARYPDVLRGGFRVRTSGELHTTICTRRPFETGWATDARDSLGPWI
jgi:hypothetical protein